MESDAVSTGIQLKSEAKLLNHDWVVNHRTCRHLNFNFQCYLISFVLKVSTDFMKANSFIS